MKELVWTTDKPTVPGWYWFRHEELPDKPFIVHVSHLHECTESGSTSRYQMKRMIGEWSGPLDPPQEKEKYNAT